METGDLVLDLVTQKECLVVGKFVDGQYQLMENTQEASEAIEELHSEKNVIIKDIEVMLRYAHQIELV